jgi:cellulose synthase/poly-beta-1,6-N-acetylglucosamine synthase-like glycosyltransferase
MSYSVIIPSAKAENVARCVAEIRRHQPGARIIVVADGILAAERGSIGGVEWAEGVQPFCYARNANLGIAAAGSDDVILCNDDALLATPGGFDRLQAASTHFAVVSATIRGRCCNERQRLTTDANHAEPSMLAFVCVYLPRSTIDAIGLLDERFENGTWEDNDYCRRVTEADLLLGTCGACAMVHEATYTTFAKKPNYEAIMAENKKRYEAKWSLHSTLLTICICSIFTRQNYLDRLLAVLRPQLSQRVELLLACDAGQAAIGEKRQRLLEQARGEFVVFIDDDDLISPDYVRQILGAIYRNPAADAITYRSKRYCDGVYEADCIYSLRNASNEGFVTIDGFKTYTRWPYHVTPLRRALALKVGFCRLDFLEDTIFATALRPLLKSEEFIEEYLYFYWWRTKRTGEQTHRVLTTA